MKKIKNLSYNKSRIISIIIGVLAFLLTISILGIKFKYSFYASFIIGITIGAIMYSVIFCIFDGPSKKKYRERLKNSILYDHSAAEVKCKSIESNPYSTKYDLFEEDRFFAILLADNKVLLYLGTEGRAFEIIDLSILYQFFDFV